MFIQCALQYAIAALLACSAAIQAQALRVVLLGTGGPRPDMSQFGPSTLVQVGGRNFLFDCGRGALLHLSELHVSPAQIDGLFISHLHSDHIVGISDLYLTGWVMGRSKPLRVWGPIGTRRMMEHLKEAYQFDLHIRQQIDLLKPEGTAIDSTEVSEGIIYNTDGVTVTSFLVDHGPVRPTLGFRVEYAHHSVTICGDTTYSEHLVSSAQRTDALIINVVDPEALSKIPFLNAEQIRKILPLHATAEQAGRIFTQSKTKLGVYTHFVPYPTQGLVLQTRRTYSGPLVVGKDMVEIDIGDEIQVHNVPTVGLGKEH